VTKTRPERIIMRVRTVRLGIVTAACAALSLGLAAPALAAPSSGDAGLYGAQDPTYDGVYRQSLAIIGLVANGQAPDARAVDWLLAQQCSDGSFTAYRADTSQPCTTKQEDENATAMAIQALTALHKSTAIALAALKKFQLPDGGFYDSSAFGAPASDANSTGLALSAFAAAGVDPASVTNVGKTADDYLRSLQVACAAKGGGAFDFQAEKTLVANDYATVQALLGQLGKSLPVAATTSASTVSPCTDPTDAASSASAAVSYVAARLTDSKGAIPSSLGSGTDWTTTANAVLDLVAAGQGADAVTAGTTALQTNAKAYAQTGAGALGTLLLVARATGASPTNFGGLDLVTTLTRSERTASPVPSPSPSASPSAAPVAAPAPALPMTGSSHTAPIVGVGAALLVLGGGALFLSRRIRTGADS
jgi:LPXTG-motif cell wall-anchored protein